MISFHRRLITKSFQEPFFEIYNEEPDYDTDKLEIEVSKALGEKTTNEEEQAH